VTEVPRVLHDMQPVVADNLAVPAGVVWRLAETGRQLDANVLNLSAGQAIGSHAEPDLDVLLVIVAGSGTMTTAGDPLLLLPGELVWMPRGSTRSLTAGADGLAYLTVHQRRPGMQIRTRPTSSLRASWTSGLDAAAAEMPITGRGTHAAPGAEDAAE
jgi:quercetin dioxygenase-like cupin family protein